MEHYTKYVKALHNQPPTGFLEFAPRDQPTQDKYSAMSSSWEGVKSSEAAIASGVYDLDMAEKNRQDLRSKAPAPKVEQTSCSIQ